MKRYFLPAEETRSEIQVARSRFIATLAPAINVDQARDFITRIKGEFSDASHNVPAFVIGHGPSVITHCSDDGEPAGTAGRPTLAVLRGSGLGDSAVVVTRYFGGTKLGKGGLVRAYGDAVRTVLELVPRAEKVPTHKVTLAMPYMYYERVKLLAACHHGKTLEENFAGEVSLVWQFSVEGFAEFQAALREMSHGTLAAEIIETDQNSILPVGEFP